MKIRENKKKKKIEFIKIDRGSFSGYLDILERGNFMKKKSEQIKFEVEAIADMISSVTGGNFISKKELGDRIGFDISKTKEIRRLDARISKAKKILAKKEKVVINKPSQGYRLADSEKEIYGESVKALGRSLGSFIAHGKLLAKVSGLIALQLDMEGLGTHLQWARKTAGEMKKHYSDAKDFAVKNDIDLKDKPQYVDDENESIDSALQDDEFWPSQTP